MEEVIKIEGGHKLNGTVRISGSKNATVALIPAAILANGPVTICGVPSISDVESLSVLLRDLGVVVDIRSSDSIVIDPTQMENKPLIHEAVNKLRASYYFMGALLGKYGHAEIRMPGGCYLGPRPIDLHLKGFEALGATIHYDHGAYILDAPQLIGNKIFLDIASVGATINIMMAAVHAQGRTTIENAAKEPHIVDLANFLNNMGANIRGAGTDTIKIKGTKDLHGGTYTIIPDQIEAGTFMIAAAATRGDVVLKNVIPRHLEIISAKLIEAGVNISEGEDSVRVWVNDDTKFKHINFIAMPYPGFPTDMQPQLVTFLTTIEGTSMAREGVWDNRFRYVNELKRMGADIRVEGKLAIIDGVNSLIGAHVKATDLRAGAAMIIAGLMAEGTTEITDIYHIDRGYENFEEKFVKLGGSIERVQVVDDLLD